MWVKPPLFASCVSLWLAGCGTSRVEVIERVEPAIQSTPSVETPMPNLDPPAASSVAMPEASIEPPASSTELPETVVDPSESSDDPSDSSALPSLDAGTPTSSNVSELDSGSCGNGGGLAAAPYHITLRSNGACLGAGEPTISEGRDALSTLVAADCGDDALWNVIVLSAGFVEIRNVSLGLSLETMDGLGTLGTDIVLMPPEDESAQHYRVVPLLSGHVSIILGTNPARCVGQSFTGKAELVTCNANLEDQQWRLQDDTCLAHDAGL